jgi:hypothetical protein
MRTSPSVSRVLIASVLAAALSGCVKGPQRSTVMSSAEYQARPAAESSLFATDEAVLRGANIEQILSSKVVIPKRARLTVLQFGHRQPWQWWSEELASQTRDLEKGAFAILQNSSRLAEVSLLPSLMVPEKQTIPYLREAAARYQADLLLVYRSSSRVYDKYKFFGPEQAKAKCVVEAILLDVRTGIVPFSSVSSQEYVAKKSREDYSFSETIARAELKATASGLEKVAEEMGKFLAEVP